MPYIKSELRERLDYVVHQLESPQGLIPGELNYLITKIVLAWLGPNPGYARNYSILSAARGVLMDVHDELYRRIMAGYEDRKCAENGDVY